MPFSCLIGMNSVALLFLSIVISLIYPQKCRAVDYVEMIISSNEKVYKTELCIFPIEINIDKSFEVLQLL